MTEPTTNGVVPAVKATQVHKAFGSLHVLKGVDMTVMPGSVTVILGPSGSGKSTFLRLINQLETLTGGEIDVDGEMIGYKYVDKDGKQVLQTLNDKEVAEQRSKLGMVFQRFNLFPHMTALENVMEAPVHVKHMDKKEARKLAIEELNRVAWAIASITIRHSFRWPAAARGHRPCACHEAGNHAVRRADFRTRSGIGGRSAERHAVFGERRHDHGGCHPRNRLRARSRRSDRIHGRRCCCGTGRS